MWNVTVALAPGLIVPLTATVTCPEASAAADEVADADDDELVAPQPHPPRASPNVTNAAATEPVVVIRMPSVRSR